MSKGSALDLLLIVVAIFIAGIVSILVYVFYEGIKTAFTEAGYGTEVTTYLEGPDRALSFMDIGIAIVFFGSGLATLISSFFVKSHPIFYFFSVLFTGLIVIVSALITNVFEYFAAHPQIAAAVNQFPYTYALITNFPFYILIMSFIVVIALYGKDYVMARMGY